jgi:hypothetical protein
MNVKQRVFLYGNSVILGSISASLLRCSQFDVTMLATALHEALSFDTPKPDILLFDSEAIYRDKIPAQQSGGYRQYPHHPFSRIMRRERR